MLNKSMLVDEEKTAHMLHKNESTEKPFIWSSRRDDLQLFNVFFPDSQWNLCTYTDIFLNIAYSTLWQYELRLFALLETYFKNGICNISFISFQKHCLKSPHVFRHFPLFSFQDIHDNTVHRGGNVARFLSSKWNFLIKDIIIITWYWWLKGFRNYLHSSTVKSVSVSILLLCVFLLLKYIHSVWNAKQ